jgi:hypothetical protein
MLEMMLTEMKYILSIEVKNVGAIPPFPIRLYGVGISYLSTALHLMFSVEFPVCSHAICMSRPSYPPLF